jgi:hypothetical protein
VKVFVATEDTQGQRDSDFCFVPEGEIVAFVGLVCGTDRDNIDGPCGCNRSLCGVDCCKCTTTFRVIDANVDLASQLLGLLYRGHWLGGKTIDEAVKIAKKEAAALSKEISKFNVGDIVEKRGDVFQKRNKTIANGEPPPVRG